MKDDLAGIIFNSITEGVSTVDKNCRISSFNKSAEQITGFRADEAVGKQCFEVFRTDPCNKRCALRERPEDLPLLVDHFIKKLRAKRGKPIDGVSDDALAMLREYPFPGNVRELENAIEHAFVMCKERILLAEHLGYPRHEVVIRVMTMRTYGNLRRIGESDADAYSPYRFKE